MNYEFRLAGMSALLISSLLSACISYAPAVLVPALTLSAEDVILNANSTVANAQIDFGLDVALNESDSLANVEILPGVRVRNVITSGAADAAGIQVGDVILSVNGLETNHPDVLAALQQQATAENDFTLAVRRNTLVFEAVVTGRSVAGSAPVQELYRIDPLATRAGYSTELVSVRGQPDMAAARVVELFPGSPLPGAGVEIGDLVLAVDGTNVNSAQGLVSRLNQDYALGERLQLSLFRNGEIHTLPIQLWDPGRRISRINVGPLLRYESSLGPPRNNLSILDFWLFAVYSYNEVEGERSHSLLGIFNFSSDYGELVEEQD